MTIKSTFEIEPEKLERRAVDALLLLVPADTRPEDLSRDEIIARLTDSMDIRHVDKALRYLHTYGDSQHSLTAMGVLRGAFDIDSFPGLDGVREIVENAVQILAREPVSYWDEGCGVGELCRMSDRCHPTCVAYPQIYAAIGAVWEAAGIHDLVHGGTALRPKSRRF